MRNRVLNSKEDSQVDKAQDIKPHPDDSSTALGIDYWTAMWMYLDRSHDSWFNDSLCLYDFSSAIHSELKLIKGKFTINSQSNVKNNFCKLIIYWIMLTFKFTFCFGEFYKNYCSDFSMIFTIYLFSRKMALLCVIYSFTLSPQTNIEFSWRGYI